VLADRVHERECDEGGESREREELLAASVSGERLPRDQGQGKRETAGQHRAQDADQQRVDLRRRELREQRRATPHDHQRERHHDRQRGRVREPSFPPGVRTVRHGMRG